MYYQLKRRLEKYLFIISGLEFRRDIIRTQWYFQLSEYFQRVYIKLIICNVTLDIKFHDCFFDLYFESDISYKNKECIYFKNTDVKKIMNSSLYKIQFDKVVNIILINSISNICTKKSR